MLLNESVRLIKYTFYKPKQNTTKFNVTRSTYFFMCSCLSRIAAHINTGVKLEMKDTKTEQGLHYSSRLIPLKKKVGKS